MQPEQIKKSNRLTNKGINVDPRAFNAIAEGFAGDRGHSLAENGVAYANNLRATKERNHYRKQFYFQCEEALKQRSIFGIINAEQLYNDPCIIDAININNTSNASPFGLFTNLQPYNPDDGFGICKAIDYYEPTLLFVSDEVNIPQVGFPCGPDNVTYGWGISGLNYGLLCISQIDDPVTNNVWCIRTPDPFSVIGTVFENNIPAASVTSGTTTLGEGLILLQYRNNINDLVTAFGPNGEPLTLPVYNLSQSKSYQVNEQVTAIQVTGVGLVILDKSNLLYGRAKNNIQHFDSGNINIYTGAPGAESWDGKTVQLAFNQGELVVKNEWVFLTPTGSTQYPYYIVKSEYSGKILGKTTGTVDGSSLPASVFVEIYAGEPGSLIDIGESITAYIDNLHGAIPANTWVLCNFVAGDVNEVGGFYVTSAQRSDYFVARVKTGSANPSNGYADVDTKITVTLLISINADQTCNLDVPAQVKFAPVCDNELVEVHWNGDRFIISRGELDGGFYAKTVQGQINNGSTGFVAMLPIANSMVNVTSLKVDTQEGLVEQNRTVWVNRNRGGFHISSKSCS